MGVDVYHIHYLLTQACLGEITPNFYYIYWRQTGTLIQVYFYLERENADDIEAIKFEIMSLFELWVGDMCEANGLNNHYEFEEIIIVGVNQQPAYAHFQKIYSIFRKSYQ